MTTTNVNAAPFSPVFNPYGWAGIGAAGCGPQFQSGTFAQPGVTNQGIPTGNVGQPANNAWNNAAGVNPAIAQQAFAAQQGFINPGFVPFGTPWTGIGQISPFSTVNPFNSVSPFTGVTPWNTVNPFTPVNSFGAFNPWTAINALHGVNPLSTVNPWQASLVNPWQNPFVASALGLTTIPSAFGGIPGTIANSLTSQPFANTFTGFPTAWNTTSPIFGRVAVPSQFSPQASFFGGTVPFGYPQGIAPITGTTPHLWNSFGTNPMLNFITPGATLGQLFSNPVSCFPGLNTLATNPFNLLSNPYTGVTNSVFGLTQPISSFGGLPLNTTFNPYANTTGFVSPTSSVYGQIPGITAGWGLGTGSPVNYSTVNPWLASVGASPVFGVGPFGTPITGVSCDPVGCVTPTGAMGLSREAA